MNTDFFHDKMDLNLEYLFRGNPFNPCYPCSKKNYYGNNQQQANRRTIPA